MINSILIASFLLPVSLQHGPQPLWPTPGIFASKPYSPLSRCEFVKMQSFSPWEKVLTNRPTPPIEKWYSISQLPRSNLYYSYRFTFVIQSSPTADLKHCADTSFTPDDIRCNHRDANETKISDKRDIRTPRRHLWANVLNRECSGQAQYNRLHTPDQPSRLLASDEIQQHQTSTSPNDLSQPSMSINDKNCEIHPIYHYLLLSQYV